MSADLTWVSLLAAALLSANFLPARDNLYLIEIGLRVAYLHAYCGVGLYIIGWAGCAGDQVGIELCTGAVSDHDIV